MSRTNNNVEITVQNAEDEPNTKATILVQNQIDFEPKVSVIIPVYNVEEYLRQCLDSVINQTLKEIEIICVDDGSTDSSLEILKEYAAKDHRITVITQQNLHAGVARNAGLAVAKGEYVHFLDSDDWVEKEVLFNSVNACDKEKTDICIFSGKMIDYKTRTIKPMPWLCKGIDKEFFLDDVKDKIFDITSPNCWNKVFKKSIIDDKDIRFQSLTNANDVFFTYAALLNSKKISIIKKEYITYRYNTGTQITSTVKYTNPLNIYSALLAVKKFAKEYKGNLFLQDYYNLRVFYSLRYQRNMSPKNFIENINKYKELFTCNLDGKYEELFKNKKIHVVFATDDNYIKYLSVALLSLKNVSISNYVISILHTNISSINRCKIKSLETKNFEIEFIDVSSLVNKYELYETDYFSKEMYYRFIIPQLFKNEDKVIYLDCDIIVNHDLAELVEYNMENKYLMACKDICSKLKKENIKQRIDCDSDLYFNSGVLVFNIKEWNKNNLTTKCFESISKYPRLMTPDQDILNLLCKNHIRYLDREWNFIWHYSFNDMNIDFLSQEDNESYNAAKKNPKIIHYTSATKPWNYKSSCYSKIWWNIAEISPFYNEIKTAHLETIISLTSYPGRIVTVNQTIESLLNQSMKAEKVILWLAPEQFPNKEKDLPKQLLDLCNRGLTIDWYHDIKSYKKLIPTLKKYPDAIIVTADDDNVYPKQWFQKLYNSYLKYPNNIHCHRVTKFYYNNMGFQTIAGGHDYYKEASFLNKLVGLGGVLYPPHCFYKDILNEDLIKQLAPTNDDQWFWFMAMLNKVKIRVVDNPDIEAHYIKGTQEKSLCNINDKGKNLFWKDFNNMIRYYPDIKTIMLSENEKHTENFKYLGKYRLDLENFYKKIMHKPLNLNNPQTFNEKIQWLKLYDSTPIKTKLADKYLVRDWVKEKIGEKYLIPLLGVYDKFEDIDFYKLPKQFVIKCNHGCGFNIIVKDKSKLNLADTKEKLDKWLNTNFAFRCGYELHYRDIKPKIIIEQYIENKGSNGDLYDYKFWCFNGKVKYIQFLSERNLDGLKMAFYDRNWIKQHFVYSHPLDEKIIEKPNNLKKMIQLAETLSKDFNHVRVDFYRLDDGHIYFGEMTFTSASGLCKWNDEKINKYFGALIKLPELAYNIDTGEYFKLPKNLDDLDDFNNNLSQLDKSTLSYKLFNFIPLFTLKQRNEKKVWKIFGLPIFKTLKYGTSKAKYYILGIPILKIRQD